MNLTTKLLSASSSPESQYRDQVGFASHFDGEEGSTQIVATSPDGPISIVGNAKITNTLSKFGGSLDLRGSSSTNQQYVNVPKINKLVLGTNDFTIECFCWLNQYVSASVVHSPILTMGASAAGNFLMVGINNLGKIRLYSYITNSVLLLGNITISPQTWTHVAITRINNVFMIFVNGVLDTTLNQVQNFDSFGGSCYVGGFFTNQRYFDGCLDDMRILNGIGLYSSSFVVPTKPYTL